MPKISATKRQILIEKHTIMNMLVCALCNHPILFDDWNIDHIRPRSKGGTDDINNLQITHIKCNLEKGNKYEYSEGEKQIIKLKKKRKKRKCQQVDMYCGYTTKRLVDAFKEKQLQNLEQLMTHGQ